MESKCGPPAFEKRKLVPTIPMPYFPSRTPWRRWSQTNNLSLRNADLQMNAATDKLIGKDSSGRFRTSRAKQYPENLRRCLATAFWRQMQGRNIVEDCDDLDPLASELACGCPVGWIPLGRSCPIISRRAEIRICSVFAARDFNWPSKKYIHR